MMTLLAHKDKLQWQTSAIRNLSLWVKARTEHACLKADEFMDVHASLSPFQSVICSRTVIPSLHSSAPHHSEASQGLSTYRHPRLTATRLLLANDASTPKCRRERVDSPCRKLSGLKPRILTARTSNTPALCRHSRQRQLHCPPTSYISAPSFL